MDDIILNKASIIERCFKRIKEEYQNNPENLKYQARFNYLKYSKGL